MLAPEASLATLPLSFFVVGLAAGALPTGAISRALEDEHDKVFRRLYRVEKSRTSPGTGLGLSMVKAIADLHDAESPSRRHGSGIVREYLVSPPRRPAWPLNWHYGRAGELEFKLKLQ